MFIQVFDRLDDTYIGGVYEVSRSDGADFSEDDFIDAWEKSVNAAKEADPAEWEEATIFHGLNKQGWVFKEPLNVVNVCY